MFGLNAAVDTTTQKLLEIQRILSVKSQLSEREKADLEDATSKLETLGFRYQMRDPVYTEYLKARAEKSSLKKRESDESEEALDPDETRRLVLEALKNMEDEGES